MTTIEKRLAVEGLQAKTGRTLSGYAIMYGVESRIGDFTESFAPGSVTKTLRDRPNQRDIVGLVDHDASQLLGRQASGTLRLQDTPKGLAFEIDLPPTPLGDEVLALAQRGDLGGVSFGFIATAEDWQGDKRTVKEAQLLEISIIKAHAAYQDTASTLSIRSLHANAESDLRKRLYLHFLGGR
ncbi:HK97 family phage prohead protease [Rhizobium rhizogenes]|uniref:HK97 family phage prohead protease n=1 Tax=Rhizobium rhizogenes TaxID=359 RepID=UPI0015727D4F|nr:HK97 family phage prohead protease [Rhizobium rhizogenes]NTF48508.1 HK97 family phage prohead protease [Rhizobium rhizogenes]NTH05893.1 HK97 family phage prohead protease [Rhizobium rhizogenes]